MVSFLIRELQQQVANGRLWSLYASQGRSIIRKVLE